MEETKNFEKITDLKTGEINLPSIDVTSYIGKKAMILDADIYKGQYGYFVKVQTETIDEITTSDEPIKIRGSRIFSLHTDDAGNVGWGEKTKLGLFLKKMKCETLEALKGKEVVLQSTTSKDGVEFLAFN